MIPRNVEVARLLRELAELEKLDEGSTQAFRVRAYEKAATAVQDLDRDVAEMTVEELTAVPGIGARTAQKIKEYLDTGKITKLEELRAKYPPELVELMQIPGLGPKTVLLLRDRLGVHNVDDLRRAIEAHQVRELPRMGAKAEEKIAKAIERLGLHGKERRTPIADAMPLALEMLAVVSAVEGVRAADYCGSLRRLRDDIGDIDILAATTDGAPVMDAFVNAGRVVDVLARGDTKSSVVTDVGMQVDLRVVAPSQYGAALLYFTGSKQHNIQLRQRAIERGWILNEYALAETEGGKVIASKTEKAIYAALDLPYIPPPMREGDGEIEAADAGELPKVPEIRHIKGDLHVHSMWSGDGRSSLEDMVAACAERGYEYIAITEHGENLSINGLSRDQVREEGARIDELRGEYPHMAIYHGAELNIGVDGSLDYDDAFLAEFDFTVASVHSFFDLPRAEQTARVIRAMQHPAVNVIGHLTGRRIGKRPGIDLDYEAVFAAAVETGCALELNGNLDRLDCPPDVVRRHRIEGVRFAISTDAHHVHELDNMRWGVAAAQRGWVPRSAIVNTWGQKRFGEWVAAKRASA